MKQLLFGLLAVVLLVRAPVWAQHYDDLLPDVYEGEDLDTDPQIQHLNATIGSLGFDPPYPEDPGNDDPNIETTPAPAPAPSGGLRIISAPPRANMCPPSGDNPKAAVKKSNKQRIKVLFVVILPSTANETVSLAFDEAQLVAALKKASRARGAQHDFDIRVSSIEYISMRKQKRLRSLLQTPQSSGLSVKVSGEADFAGEDEMVASEIVQLLSDAPSAIFPQEEFGSVRTAEVTMTEVSGTSSWVLPVAGTLGGLACLGASVSLCVYMRRANRASMKKYTPNLHEEGFIPVDDAKLRAMSTMSNVSQVSLLSSMSSRNYGDIAAPAATREKQWNNLGYYNGDPNS